MLILLLVFLVQKFVESRSQEPNQDTITYFFDTFRQFQQNQQISGRKILQLVKENNSTNAAIYSILERYFTTEEFEEWTDDFIDRCGQIARKFSIGQSSDNRELWVIEISNNPGKKEAKPNVKYIGNIHGNEPSARQLLPALAEYLCLNYKNIGSKADKIVSGIHLYLLPVMNPDGYACGKRGNKFDIDLNRNFPDQYNHSDLFWTKKVLAFEQEETKAVHEWSLSMHFVSSIQFHEGALVVNYPFDGRPDMSDDPIYEACPDDATFRYLGNEYVTRNPLIGKQGRFPGGMTNGALWYPVYGGMQDWNYLIAKCFEFTMEISGVKTWDERNLGGFSHGAILNFLWDNNLDAMLTYALQSALGGVTGFVKDADTDEPLVDAIITIEGIDWTLPVLSQFGDFSRPLAPGEYTIIASKEGYRNVSEVIVVPADGSGVSVELLLTRIEEVVLDSTIKMVRP